MGFSQYFFDQMTEESQNLHMIHCSGDNEDHFYDLDMILGDLKNNESELFLMNSKDYREQVFQEEEAINQCSSTALNSKNQQSPVFTPAPPSALVPASPPAEEQPAPRWDNKVRNLGQNLNSTGKTIIPKILSSSANKDRRRTEIKERRIRLLQFLKQHKAQNNQLIIPFFYLFAKKEGASPDQFIQIYVELRDYLDKRIAESSAFGKDERSIFVEKVNIQKKIAAQYFNGNCVELDFEWLKNIGADLYTGRQAKTIAKPLKELEEIQKSLNGEGQGIEFLASPLQHIQAFFESYSQNE